MADANPSILSHVSIGTNHQHALCFALGCDCKCVSKHKRVGNTDP